MNPPHQLSCLQLISIILGVHCAIAFSWCALSLSPLAPVDLKPVYSCFPATAAVIFLPVSGWESSSECPLCLLNLWSLSFSLGLFSVRLQVGQGGKEQEREAVPYKESWCIHISRCDTAGTAPLAKSVGVIHPGRGLVKSDTLET